MRPCCARCGHCYLDFGISCGSLIPVAARGRYRLQMERFGFIALALAAGIGLCSCALSAAALITTGDEDDAVQPTVQRPLSSQRLVALFEFDHLEPYDLPRHWDMYKGGILPGLPGAADRRFPAWNTASLDQTISFRGQGSVRLAINGGSVRLRLDPGVVPVFPDTEYLVSGRITTRGLRHARAAISARYLDKQTRPIEATEQRSDLIIGGGGGEEWMLALVPLADGIAEAAYIQIDLEILQPEEYDIARLGPHQVWPQDFSGEAWFDDVAVVQVPRVRIATQSPVNIIEAPHDPEITVQIRDLAGQALVGRLTIQDAAGAIVDSSTHSVRGGGEMWVWRPAVPRFGWYRALLEVSAGEQHIGATYVDFAWLPRRADLTPGGDAAAFGLTLDRLPRQHIRHLAPLIHHAGAGAVTIPVWGASLPRDDIPEFAHELAQSIASLQMSATQISFSLPHLPGQLAHAAHLDGSSPALVFSADESIWAPYLIPLLDRFGQTVQRWTIGGGLQSVPAGDLPRADAVGTRRLREVLARLVPGPVVALPWPGDVVIGSAAEHADEVVVTIPSSIPAAAVPAFVEMWASSSRPPVSLVLEPHSYDEFPRPAVAAELARKMVMVWSTRARQTSDDVTATMVVTTQPWEWPGEFHTRPMPRIELPVWRNVADRLRGRRIVGEFPAGPGIFCLIMAPASGSGPGALVAWRRGAVQAPILKAYLGPGSIASVDVFGNEESVPLGAGTGGAVHHIAISDSPIFIEGVDVDLVSFLASFRLDRRELRPGSGEHHAILHLTNPWRTHMQGRLTILEPGGVADEALHAGTGRDRAWHFTPRMLEFAIAPGQTDNLPVRIGFSAAEEHGPRELVAEIVLAGVRYPPLRVRTGMEIRLDQLELDVGYRLINRAGDLDVVLEAIVTNRAEVPATLELTAFAAGHPRARASISNLPPGASALRRFSFPGGGRTLKDDSIAISVYDPETGARINRSVRIE